MGLTVLVLLVEEVMVKVKVVGSLCRLSIVWRVSSEVYYGTSSSLPPQSTDH